MSTIFSIYDPLGLAGPAVIPAKRIFQETCNLKLQWDDDLPKDLANKWHKWTSDIPLLCNYEVARCCKPKGTISSTELHLFSDGSKTAYGVIAYARFIMVDSTIHCAPLMAKARLIPLNNTTLRTIPRIELNAA